MAERKTCKSKNASRESGFRHRQNKETQLEMVDNSNKLCECGSEIERDRERIKAFNNLTFYIEIK